MVNRRIKKKTMTFQLGLKSNKKLFTFPQQHEPLYGFYFQMKQ
jgi:hypothetical protein